MTTNCENSGDSLAGRPSLPQSKLSLSGLREAAEYDAIVRGIEADREVYETKAGGLRRFLEDAWRYFDPSPFTHGWHIDAICEHLTAVTWGDIRHLLINQPPRTSKSNIVSVAWPAWVWTLANGPAFYRMGPKVQWLFASHAQTLSLRDNRRMRRLITSPWYQHHWGDRVQLTSD
jgi:hypothetical protein